MGQEHLIRISKGGRYILKQFNQTIVPPLELSPFPLISAPPPLLPLSTFLNWLWNWNIFLNYLLYLLNKVFNVPVLKFRLSLPFTYLPSHSIIPSKYSTKLLFHWSTDFGYHISFLSVVLPSKAFPFWKEKSNLNWVPGFPIQPSNTGCIREDPSVEGSKISGMVPVHSASFGDGTGLSFVLVLYSCLVDSLGLSLTSEF